MHFTSPICELFEIEYPIVLAGMGGASGPELAAAVSNAGGLGVLGGAGAPPDALEEWIRRTRSLTDRPFGVDTLLPASVPDTLDQAADRQRPGKAGAGGGPTGVAQGTAGGGHNSPIGTMALIPQAVDAACPVSSLRWRSSTLVNEANRSASSTT